MKALFVITALVCAVPAARAQWQVDVRLTAQPASSITPFNYKCIAATGTVVHVVWYDDRDGNFEIYYKRSPDGGLNWGPDTRLTNSPGTSWFSSVAVSGSDVHVVWMDDRDGNFEVYYKRSTDGGVSWSGDVRLTNEAAPSRFPSIAASGSSVHVTWQDMRDGNSEIYYKRSQVGGQIWGMDTRLTNDPADSMFASVAASGELVNVAWEEYRDGNGEVYAKHSTDGGSIWSADMRLTNDPSISFSPSAWACGSHVHVVWYDRRDNNDAEIYYKRSTDGGSVWGPDTRLTNSLGGSFHPSICASGPEVHVVWHDERDGNGEVYDKRSTDAGSSWGSDVRLTIAGGVSSHASVAVAGQLVHVVWQDDRDGNQEIYYKRDPTGAPGGLDGCSPAPRTPFCFGDGTGATCPCANTGAPGRGCASSAFAGGALLSASGVAGSSAGTDTLTLTATEIPGPGLFFQSSGVALAPLNFGDGLLCASVGIIRLGVVFPTAGVASYPGGLSPVPIHAAGPVSSGDIKHYQCWYRSQPGLCSANNYNLTQGLTITWGP